MEKKTNARLVIAGVFIATFMTAVEGTIVTTAMPTIVGSLHGIEIMNWVFSIYLLTNAMITPIYGKLVDNIGRKPIFILGIVIFVLGSALCGLSNSMLTLIVSRAIQGIGAGAIMPVSLTIIADLYSFEHRAKILGLTSAAWGVSSVFGPLLGGFIVDTVGWHWIFFINIPIGLVLVTLMHYFFVEEPRKHEAKKMDVLGSFLLMLLLLSLLLGSQMLSDNGLTLGTVSLFLAAVLFLFGFVRVEKTAEDPVISLHLFQSRTFVIVNSVAALLSGFLMAFDVYIPMWMQGVLGKSAGIGGLVLAPMSILWMIGSFLTGKMLRHMTEKRVLLIGMYVIFIGSIGMLLLPFHSSYWWFFVIMSVIGLGYGIALTTTTVEAQSSVPEAFIGVATSFNTLSRTIGQTVMISVFGIVMNLQLQNPAGINAMNKLINPQTARQIASGLREMLRRQLFQGLHAVYLAGLLLVIASVIFTLKIRSQKTVE